MIKVKKILQITLLLLAIKASAYEPSEGNLNAGLGYFISQNQLRGSEYNKTNPTFGGIALIIEGDLNSKSNLELNLQYFQKNYVRKTITDYVSEKTEVLNVNMGYRYWLFKPISAGLGLSSLYSIGEPTVIYGKSVSNMQLDTSASSIVKYGLEFSLQFEIYNSQSYTLLIDNRYNYSLSNKDGESADHMTNMLIYKKLIQSK